LTGDRSVCRSSLADSPNMSRSTRPKRSSRY